MHINYELLSIIFNINSVVCFWKFKTSSRFSERSDDIFMDSMQLMQRYNYTSETHNVITEDGYKIKNFRIPSKGPPVLLVHGIGDSSDCWLVLGPKYSLAYQLADAGYDVWLFNARGNRYSKGHVSLTEPKRYWNFSYEEIGTRDIPAVTDYILLRTGYTKLTYLGFSQGTTVFFVMCSLRPEYNEKFDHAILLAPVAGLKHMKHPIVKLLSKSAKMIKSIIENNNFYEAFPFNERLNLYHAFVCAANSPLRLLCELELFINFGLEKINNIVIEKLPAITTHIPAGTSFKVFLHFLQIYTSKRFQRYDYGSARNLRTYASIIPPIYDLSLISVPLSLIISEADWFSDVKDVEILLRKVKSVTKSIYINESQQFSHFEFVFGTRVNSVINKPVLTILNDLRKT